MRVSDEPNVMVVDVISNHAALFSSCHCCVWPLTEDAPKNWPHSDVVQTSTTVTFAVASGRLKQVPNDHRGMAIMSASTVKTHLRRQQIEDLGATRHSLRRVALDLWALYPPSGADKSRAHDATSLCGRYQDAERVGY